MISRGSAEMMCGHDVEFFIHMNPASTLAFCLIDSSNITLDEETLYKLRELEETNRSELVKAIQDHQTSVSHCNIRTKSAEVDMMTDKLSFPSVAPNRRHSR